MDLLKVLMMFLWVIITAISKMCIKGNKGINLKMSKNLINEIEYFFLKIKDVT